MKLSLLFAFIIPLTGFSQSYTSYFTGNLQDIITIPQKGICMMGGATEDDNAMKWFLQRASGGDVLVLRASGSNGYNSYLYAELGIPVNSVETIVCHNASASYDPYVLQKIRQAEAIWFAGGDQWNYVSYWRNTPVDSLINQAIAERNIVVGGTSAGMAILGKFYFSAQNGTVTSSSALANPYNNNVTVDSNTFIRNQYLETVVTDSHFDDPDRRGRFVAFLSRIFTDYGMAGKGIACDEYTAVCIEPDGTAKVFGGYPGADDNAYFVQTNCDLQDQSPENCSPGTPLTWNADGLALKVYRVKGMASGAGTFNLNDWKTGTNGVWLHWSVNNGVFSEQPGTPPVCAPASSGTPENYSVFKVFPNPSHGKINIVTLNNNECIYAYQIFNVFGQQMPFNANYTADNTIEIDTTNYEKGVYFLQITTAENRRIVRTIVRK